MLNRRNLSKGVRVRKHEYEDDEIRNIRNIEPVVFNTFIITAFVQHPVKVCNYPSIDPRSNN